MNREQMIEKAARIMCDRPQDSMPRWDSADSALRGVYLSEARMILDAILPQVTTVEELEALPGWTHVATSREVYYWRASVHMLRHVFLGYDYEPADVLAQGPLTVAWSPS